ncbi:SMI1/KNR4 family protein [Streptomyces sp. NPDC013181]|uniref:SMI1/KNR4 family protein n=1 Tax=Streptomyces sp. NPDC013181 TaxID=3364864 RepID=UPI0036AAC4E3
MRRDPVQEAWDRIDAWLREHAPRTFATLRPPAEPEEIAAAERELGLAFPAELVASLRRHNGAVGGADAFQFSTHDRLLTVSEIVHDTLFMRDVAEGLDDEDSAYYWTDAYVKFGSYEVTADGLTIDCGREQGACGAIGRFFDETGTDFGTADSLGAYLTELADLLEGGHDSGAVTFNGRLIWEWAESPRPEWGSAVEPLPRPDEELPQLDLSCRPTDVVHVSRFEGLDELGALIAVLPRERVAEAARKQLRRVAEDTGLDRYPEVGAALDALDRGEAPPPREQTGPPALRLRAVIAQAEARRDHVLKWAAETTVHGIWGSPYECVRMSAHLHGRLHLGWRTDLHEDLGSPPLPPIPDDRFWGALRNPAIDNAWHAAQYAGQQDEQGEQG